MKTKLPFWFGLFSLFVSGCSYLLVQHGQIQIPMTERVKAAVEKERGLEFKFPCSIEFSRKEQTKKLIREMIERDYSAEELENFQKAFYALGLVDETETKVQDLIDLYAEQAAGFYDPITKKLYLTDWLNKKDVLVALTEFIIQKDLSGELLLSHELTHALQDQHYDLEKFILEDKGNLDMMLARHAVAEGDATAAGFNVVVGPLGKTVQNSPELPRMIQKEATRFGGGLDNLNPILREQLLFPYYGGLYFVREVLLAHGWEGMKKVYEDPPDSTEQILHPEKYLKVPDRPVELARPDLGWVEKEGYKPVLSNTLGELGLRVLLEERSSKKKSAAAAQGWGNDRYWVWEKEGGQNEFPFVWITAWDSELDAREFLELYEKCEKKRHKGKKNHILRLERKENRVLVVEGFPEELAEKILKSL